MKKRKIIFTIAILLILITGVFIGLKTLGFDNISGVYVFTEDGTEISLKNEDYKNVFENSSAIEKYRTDGPFIKNIDEILVVKKGFFQESKYDIGFNSGTDFLLIRDSNDENKIYQLDSVLSKAIINNYVDIQSKRIKEDENARHRLTVEGKNIDSSEISFLYNGGSGSEILKSEQLGKDDIIIKLNKNEFDYDFISDFGGSYTVLKDGVELFKGDMSDGLPLPKRNGRYDYNIYSKKTTDPIMYEQLTHFVLDLDLPPVYELNKSVIEQGSFAELRIFNPKEGVEPFIESDHSVELEFKKSKNGDYLAVIPSSYGRQTGNMHLKFGYEDDIQEADLQIQDRDFSVQELEISQNIIDETRTEDSYDEFNKYYPPSLTKDLYTPDVSSVEEMNFILPTSGVLTTEFGETRHINGSPTHYHHSGLDIAWDSATAIVSTADGVVALARNLKLTGNTVVISHGYGLFSTYYHMSEIDVKEGDFVEGGSKIGFQGTTGFSTGVHLHFMISYGDVNMDAGYFIYGEKVTYNNYKQLFGDMAR